MAADLANRLPEFGHVAWVSETGSTNADLLAQARSNADRSRPMPWLLGTHLQVGGRGRAGRPWSNDSGACLMFSCAFEVHMPGHRLPSLSPLAGLAACEALRSLVGDAVAREIRVKWPNDVQYGQKKLGGILVETTRVSANNSYVVVIGMGLNLSNASALSEKLGRQVADWSQVSEAADRPATLTPAAIASQLATYWTHMLDAAKTTGFVDHRDRYVAVDALHGHIVNVIDQGSILFSGEAAGYDEHGRLQVKTPDGLMPVSVGDVSVRVRTQA